MNHEVCSEQVKHGRRTYNIRVWHDECVESPLENGSNDDVFITYNKGSRSGYGNTPLDDDDHIRIGKSIELLGNKSAQLAEAFRIADDPDYEPLGEPLIGLPVYVYEHGQVSMRTHAFSCPWDSGQSGFIYITRKTALDWQGGKRLTKGKLARVLKSLEAVVEEYGMWCNGECYYYTVEDEDGNVIDDLGCGGFIGTDWLFQEAKMAVASHHKWRVMEACKRRIAAAKERFERLMWAARGVLTT